MFQMSTLFGWVLWRYLGYSAGGLVSGHDLEWSFGESDICDAQRAVIMIWIRAGQFCRCSAGKQGKQAVLIVLLHNIWEDSEFSNKRCFHTPN